MWDVPKLKEIGVKGIFLPGRRMQAIIEFIQTHAGHERLLGEACSALSRQPLALGSRGAPRTSG
jgi:hypothetical protein